MFVQLRDFVAFSLTDNAFAFGFCNVDAFRMLLFTDEELFMAQVGDNYNDSKNFARIDKRSWRVSNQVHKFRTKLCDVTEVSLRYTQSINVHFKC